MDKRSKIALYSIGIIVLLLIVAEVTKPKAINWRDSYSMTDKIPLGCYVLFNELKKSDHINLEVSNKTLYENLNIYSDSSNANLILINNYISIEDEDCDKLLKFVEKGNNVFISSNYLYGKLSDTLGIVFEPDRTGFFKSPSLNTFASKSLKSNEALFEDVIENTHIKTIDTSKTVVLGYVITDSLKNREINYVKIPFGENKGHFYIHSNPFAFTNYHMLNGKENYVASVLSYFLKDYVIWDNHYKSGRKIVTSPLRFILANKALKYALYITLFALGLYIIFKSKRTQRIIPVIEPPKNATVEFTRTIGNLYFQYGDYSNIINQKITYFMEYIRSTYYLNTSDLNEHFITKLATKSTNSIKETKSLIDFITFLKSKPNHNEKDLIELNRKIEEFSKK